MWYTDTTRIPTWLQNDRPLVRPEVLFMGRDTRPEINVVAEFVKIDLGEAWLLRQEVLN